MAQGVNWRYTIACGLVSRLYFLVLAGAILSLNVQLWYMNLLCLLMFHLLLIVLL